MLYNGKEPFPAKQDYNLSDLFARRAWADKPPLELTVTVYNIGGGQNAEIVGRSETLTQYAQFVSKVREREAGGMELTEAVGAAVKECIERGILVDYLEQYGAEVLNMLTAEWNMDTALDVRYDEGRVEGRVEGLYDVARRMLGRNRTVREIMEDTGLTADEIAALPQSVR